MKKVRVLGLDVHADTIAVAIAEPGEGEVRFAWNDSESGRISTQADQETRPSRAAEGPVMKQGRQATFCTGSSPL